MKKTRRRFLSSCIGVTSGSAALGLASKGSRAADPDAEGCTGFPSSLEGDEIMFSTMDSPVDFTFFGQRGVVSAECAYENTKKIVDADGPGCKIKGELTPEVTQEWLFSSNTGEQLQNLQINGGRERTLFTYAVGDFKSKEYDSYAPIYLELESDELYEEAEYWIATTEGDQINRTLDTYADTFGSHDIDTHGNILNFQVYVPPRSTINLNRAPRNSQYLNPF